MSDSLEEARIAHQDQFLKDKSTLIKMLLAARCYDAIKALSFAEPHHAGFRKDGMTPAYHHQIQMAFTAYNLRDSLLAADLSPDRLIALMILHDTYEDHQTLQIQEVAKAVSQTAAQDMVALSKIRDGERLPNEIYYNGLLEDPIWIIGKLLDRQNNVGTLFELPPAKQVDYVEETRHLVAVAKKAVLRYPEVAGIIQSLRVNLKSYLNLYLGTLRLGQTEKAPEIIQGLVVRRLLTPGVA